MIGLGKPILSAPELTHGSDRVVLLVLKLFVRVDLTLIISKSGSDFEKKPRILFEMKNYILYLDKYEDSWNSVH